MIEPTSDNEGKQTLIEYKLLADFMGWGYDASKDGIGREGWFDENTFVVNDILDMEFNSDWNMLMKVIDKIESIKHQKYGRFTVDIENDCCKISATNRTKETTYNKTYCVSGNKLKSAYNAVIMFIEWYNTNIIKK